jgi:hypothetical protein
MLKLSVARSPDGFPIASPSEASAEAACRYQASVRNRLRKPGPATSTFSRLPSSVRPSSSASFSAVPRGGSPRAGASSIAAFVE